MTSSSVTPIQDGGEEQGASSSSSLHGPPRFSPQPIILRQRLPSSDPFIAPALPIIDENHDRTAVPEYDAGTAEGRYSMRTRQPRQLKPYAFDRLEYKHQLKHHPDAIVKLNGYRSPVESSSLPPFCSDGDDTDAAENPAGEAPSEDAQLLSRMTRKRKHRTNTEHASAPPATAHRRTSKAQVSLRSPPLARRPTGSSAITGTDMGPSMPDLDGDERLERSAMWYPDVFNDLSSGLGSDDVPLDIRHNDLRDRHTPPPRLKRRRVIFSLHTECLYVNVNPQRTQLKLPHLSPLASSPHSSGPSSPLSQQPSVRTISSDLSSDESSSRLESTRSSDDVVLLSDGSAIMLVDDHESLPPLKLERPPPPNTQKRHLQPSLYPVITDFFTRGPHKKKSVRKQRIVPPEKSSRLKHAPGKVGASGNAPYHLTLYSF
jgi:hypothetical protein